jgi:hypothetical protein
MLVRPSSVWGSTLFLPAPNPQKTVFNNLLEWSPNPAFKAQTIRTLVDRNFGHGNCAAAVQSLLEKGQEEHGLTAENNPELPLHPSAPSSLFFGMLTHAEYLGNPIEVGPNSTAETKVLVGLRPRSILKLSLRNDARPGKVR